MTSGYKAELQLGTMFLKNQTVFGVFMGHKEDLRLIIEMVARGTLHGIIHDTFPLKDAAQAHQAMEKRAFFGKLILTVP